MSAVARDSNYADALSLLASLYAVLPDWSNFRRDSSMTLGMAAAHRALALGDNQAVAHAALGLLHGEDDPAQALTELQRAVALDSTSAPALHWLGLEYASRGDIVRATAMLGRAHRADPLASHIHYTYASMLAMQGRVNEALAETNHLLALQPLYPLALVVRAQIASIQHDTAAVVLFVDSSKTESLDLAKGGPVFTTYGYASDAQIRIGQTEKARQRLPRLRQLEPTDQSGWAAFSESVIWAGVGQRDSMYAAMRRSLRVSPGRARFFGFSLSHKPYMREPEWAAIMKSVGLDWTPF
jgi:predicted Zn-dependent protease